MLMNYNKGSEWKKWDLHVHSPASFYWNDGKKFQEMTAAEKENELKRFIEIVNQSDVEVFCLMDYWTFDWYLELRDFLNDNPGLLTKTIFPGMELRIECPVDYRLNIHCILSDKLSKQELIDFKSELYIRSIDKKLSNDSLIRFARSLDDSKAQKHGFQPPASLDNEKLLQLGSMTAEITKDSLEKAFNQIPKDTGYIILPYDTTDGLKELNWEDHPHDDNYFMQSAHIIETRDSDNVDLFVGKKTAKNENYFDNFFKTLGNKAKPCVSGSDAHKYCDYGRYPSNRITWIKADPTFDGLKQIIYEPEIRVRIQENNPTFDKEKLVIDYLEISNSTGYIIPDEKIVFNRDLVCIIGGRGSGKSALLETLAYCFNAHLQNDKPLSLIFFYYQLRADAKISIQYLNLDNNPIDLFETSLLSNNETPCTYPFLYISQNQIEKIAADKPNLHNLAFETVITNSSFTEELRKIKFTIENLLKDIENNNQKILTQRELVSKTDQKSLEVDTLKFKEELKLLESDSTRDVLSKLNKAQEKRSTIIQAKDLQEEILIHLSDTKEFVNIKMLELYSILDILGISHTDFNFNFLDFEKHLNEINEKLNLTDNEAEYQKILFEVKNILKDKLDVSVEHIEALRNKISSNESAIKSLQKDKDLFSNLIKVRYQLLVKLNSFFEEYVITYKRAVEEYSTKNEDILGALDLETELIFNTEKLCDVLLEKCVDRRKIKSKEKLREHISLSSSLSYGQYIDWINVFFDEEFDIENYDAFYAALKNDIEKESVLNIPRLSTKINYKLGPITKNIDQLSLGQKGTILLKLFLSIGNNCPIIIDQPEDHLDNSFIYSDLVQTIRNAKKKRQIIVVTHNANLVVNGDADQVIVAHYDNERITHTVSGSLENPIIKENVTTILEGGMEAFRKREKKYQHSDSKVL